MDAISLAQNPFAVLTFIAAPALLTNASSVMALSTINRMLHTRDRMHQMLQESEAPANARDPVFLAHVARIERQALLLLRALHWIYVAIGSFSAATLVTLIGAGVGQLGNNFLMHVIIVAGLLLGVSGISGLVGGCVNLFKATQLSLVNIREEAAQIYARQKAAAQSDEL